MHQFIKQNFYTISLAKVLLLLIFASLISVGVLSQAWAWLMLAILALLVVVSPILYGAFFVILAIPFFVILPNPWVAEMPMWRPLFLGLFGWWLLHLVTNWWRNRGVAIQDLQTEVELYPWQKQFWLRLYPWDKFIGLFLAVAAGSLVFARFPVHGLKQLLFIVNILLLYFVVSRSVKTVIEFALLKKVIAASLFTILGLGFLQYFLTFFSEPYYFWQYWALLVSKAYYGISLAEVLIYSNSWFTSGEGVKALRMFGILQDTHAFGVLTIFALALSISYFKPSTEGLDNSSKFLATFRNFVASQRKTIWLAVLMSSLGIILSGTRGVWIGMLPVLFLTLFLLWKKIYQRKLRFLLLAQLAVVFWLVASPLLSMGFNWIRSFDVDDDILKRASSIYNLSESSNVGRLQIWQESFVFALKNPTGTGYGNFITSVVQDIPEGLSFEEAAADVNERYNLPQKFITAHNLFLHLLVELGLLGLLSFALIVFIVMKSIWQLLFRFNSNLSERDLLLVLCLTFAFLWQLSYALFDVTILNDRVLMFTTLLLALLGYLHSNHQVAGKQSQT